MDLRLILMPFPASWNNTLTRLYSMFFPAHWNTGPLAAFDLETTGVDYHNDRIVSACVTLHNHENAFTKNWLINPGIDIPKQASAIHGITTDKAQREGQPAKQAIEEIIFHLVSFSNAEIPVIAFNARFDCSFIEAEALRHGVVQWRKKTGKPICIIDPLVIDKHIEPRRRGKRTLGAVCKQYGVNLGSAHQADADAIAALELAVAIADKSRSISNSKPKDLHKQQIKWAKEQAISLQEYFIEKGKKDEKVETLWPFVDPKKSILGASRQVVNTSLSKYLKQLRWR